MKKLTVHFLYSMILCISFSSAGLNAGEHGLEATVRPVPTHAGEDLDFEGNNNPHDLVNTEEIQQLEKAKAEKQADEKRSLLDSISHHFNRAKKSISETYNNYFSKNSLAVVNLRSDRKSINPVYQDTGSQELTASGENQLPTSDSFEDFVNLDRPEPSAEDLKREKSKKDLRNSHDNLVKLAKENLQAKIYEANKIKARAKELKEQQETNAKNATFDFSTKGLLKMISQGQDPFIKGGPIEESLSHYSPKAMADLINSLVDAQVKRMDALKRTYKNTSFLSVEDLSKVQEAAKNAGFDMAKFNPEKDSIMNFLTNYDISASDKNRLSTDYLARIDENNNKGLAVNPETGKVEQQKKIAQSLTGDTKNNFFANTFIKNNKFFLSQNKNNNNTDQFKQIIKTSLSSNEQYSNLSQDDQAKILNDILATLN